MLRSSGLEVTVEEELGPLRGKTFVIGDYTKATDVLLDHPLEGSYSLTFLAKVKTPRGTFTAHIREDSTEPVMTSPFPLMSGRPPHYRNVGHFSNGRITEHLQLLVAYYRQKGVPEPVFVKLEQEVKRIAAYWSDF